VKSLTPAAWFCAKRKAVRQMESVDLQPMAGCEDGRNGHHFGTGFGAARVLAVSSQGQQVMALRTRFSSIDQAGSK